MKKGPKGLRRSTRRHKTNCHYAMIREWASQNSKISNKLLSLKLNLSVSQVSRIISNMIKDGALAYRFVTVRLKTTLSGKIAFSSTRELVVNISRKISNAVKKIVKKFGDIYNYAQAAARQGETVEIFRNFSQEQKEAMDRLNQPPSPLDIHVAASLERKYELGWDY